MFTNRFFNLFVAIALVTLAAFTGWQTIATDKAVADRSYDQVEQAQPGTSWSLDQSIGKHEDRYDRMNGFEGTDHLYKYEDRYDAMNDGFLSNDHSYNASKYEDRYDRMNHSLGADPSYIAGKYEDRYDRMNHSLGADPSYISGKHEDRYDFMNDFPGTDR